MSSAGSPARHPALFGYPAQAAFGHALPKAKIYEHSAANTRMKDLFVQQVEQIIWQYKLAPETIRLQARPGVPEIQVFNLQLKTPELHREVLRCIDGAVQFPIIFELSYRKRIQVVAAYKRPNEADRGRWVLSDYFATEWLSADALRAPMPVALHLGGLYEQLLHTLMPLPVRPTETLAELVERVELAGAKKHEVDRVAARLATEKQFNRKVELNSQLRLLRSEYDALSR